MPFHDFLANPKSKSSPAEPLRGKEGHKYLCRDILGHPCPSVGHGKTQALLPSLPVCAFAGPHQKSTAAAAHRIDRVSHEITKDLPNFAIKAKRRSHSPVASRKLNLSVQQPSTING